MIRSIIMVLVAWALALSVGCGCPEVGPNAAGKYRAQLLYACQAVEGCDPASLTSIRVSEVSNPPEEGCISPTAVGCYCAEFSCTSILVMDHDVPLEDGTFMTQQDIMLHEYIHASLDFATGDANSQHDSRFQAALQRAYKIWRPSP